MRRALIRSCAVAVVTVASLGTAPVTPVHAGGGCISDYSGDELNPIVSRSDALATGDSGRFYADITGVCATAGVTNTISITTVANIPTASRFPTTNGDLGIIYKACADANGPIANAIIQVGIGHRGEPVHDGPFPPSQGFKVCTWMSVQAATPNDYGIEIRDPAGVNRDYDFPQIPGFPAPTISGNTITLSMPSTMCITVNPPAPPMVGIARQHCYPFFNGTNLQNVVAEIEPSLAAIAPFPLCVNDNPPGISCNGNQIIGPITQLCVPLPQPPSPYPVLCVPLDGTLPPLDWAPGRITCITPGNLLSCSSAGTPTSSPTLAGNGYDLGLQPTLSAVVTCSNPFSPGPAVPPANNLLVTCGSIVQPYTYNPCQAGSTATQDQGDLYTTLSAAGEGSACTITSASSVSEYDTEFGRITPAQLPTVDGFTVGPTFLASGWNV